MAQPSPANAKPTKGGDKKDEEDYEIKQWRIKKLIQSLEEARGNGTSMISLIIRPGDQISRYVQMLADEYGTASNIKNRVNRQSVLGAITSTQQKLKLFNRTPENGLVIYCGTVIREDGKEKHVNLSLEPHKPINTSLYLCDNKFHTECLSELLESDQRFGFIVMDGQGTLFGVVSGNTKEVLHRVTVDLPKKHGRGGQSALRFARLRLEKRHNYVRKISELAVQFFVENDRPNVAGIVMAGLADFKTELAQSDMLDQRLAKIIVKIVDVSYGGDNGFNQAIELAADALKNVKFIQEKNLISRFFEEIGQDTGKYCFGIRDTMSALDAGAVETLILYEDLEVWRYVLKSNATGEEKVVYLDKEQEKNPEVFKDHEQVARDSLVDWFAENYKRFGAVLQFVTNKSQQGSQFVKGFGGIGGLLRWKMDFTVLEEDDGVEFDDDDLEF
jgi:peptide chain release factor subunit 1